ncbi:MAG: nitric oxide synthase oxygenase [Verrucomicrobiales bacterium]
MNPSKSEHKEHGNKGGCPLSGQIAHRWDLEVSSKDLCPEKHDERDITASAREAWRNSVRCIGRLHWKSLKVNDAQSIDKSDEIFEALLKHIDTATNEGAIRPTITVFKPWDDSSNEIRIWNHQLIRYAGHVAEDGTVIGDPMSKEITRVAKLLGWKPNSSPSRFDVLPLILQCGEDLKYYPIPDKHIAEVVIRHPKYDWLEGLGLKWYGVPIISDMIFATGSKNYPCAPFNGWYMGTEIGARDLGDEDRYNQLPVIANRLGMDMTVEASLWKDHALLILNEAVLWSFNEDGIRIVDHHTASKEFSTFCNNEEKKSRIPNADWSWIVPPMSSSATSAFHSYYELNLEFPNYLLQQHPWHTERGKALISKHANC